MSTSSVPANRWRIVPASDRPSDSPPIRICRKSPWRARAAMAASWPVSANSSRIIVGTMPTRLMRCSAKASRKGVGSNLGCSTSVPPRSSVSRLSHRPKLKVMFSTPSVRSAGPNPSRRSIRSILPWKASCAITTPLGAPVDPEVKTTSAAPRNSARSGGASAASADSAWAADDPGCRSSCQRARLRCWKPCTTAAGVLRCTGTATPPACQTPSSAAMSIAWFDTSTCTGSCGCSPAWRSRAATAPACSARSA